MAAFQRSGGRVNFYAAIVSLVHRWQKRSLRIVLAMQRSYKNQIWKKKKDAVKT